MEKDEVKLSIELTVDQWNVVINAVAQRPFAEVSGLIQIMQSQAISQLPEPPPEYAEKQGTD